MPGMLQALGDRTSQDRGGEEKAVKGKLSNSASEFGLFKKFLFIYLFIFIFGCVGSSFLCEGFL